MSRIESLLIERRTSRGHVPEWAEALSTAVGRVPLSLLDQETTQCFATGVDEFCGSVESGMLSELVLAKVRTKTPHFLRFSLQEPSGTNPAPAVLIFQISGSCRVDQRKRSCTLGPGNWCLVDTADRFRISSFCSDNENLSLRLDRPAEPELLSLLASGVARRWNGTTGISRVLQASLREAFNQMSCLRYSSEIALQRALVGMAWDAIREQLAAPVRDLRQELQLAHIKRSIESRLEDSKLSVESIARACDMSVRVVHRAFVSDPAESVSKYIWTRRLSHCADDLRDIGQINRPLTDICFAWGFNSTSHFSRRFKEQFGVTPREYRRASEGRHQA